jgi:protocatechuate 3,4-dioxygenase beta subunit
VDEHDLGLTHDLSTLVGRRQVLGLLAGFGLVSVVGCTGSTKATESKSPSSRPVTPAGSSSAAAAAASTPAANATPTAAVSCVDAIPHETPGPFPGDGSNGPNILTSSGIVRRDIRNSFGSASGVAKGVPVTINLTITDTGKNCAARAGAAVYLWHCDTDGAYSMYDGAAVNENYLRGVQAADSSGLVTFKSVFPGAYPGRWPHMHFEVYPSLGQATQAATLLITSQLALPADACKTVYATKGYGGSLSNLGQTSLDSDNVFSDGYDNQLATVTGDVKSGLTMALVVAV